MRRAAMLCAATVLVMIWTGGLTAAELTVSGFTYSGPLYEGKIGLDLSGVVGATGVRAITPGGTAIALADEGPLVFGAWTGQHNTFAAFYAETVGQWRLVVEFGAGNEAAYDVVVNDYDTPFTAGSFPAAPTITYPLDGATGVAQTPTITWDNGGLHSGAMESLFVNLWSVTTPGVGAMDSSGGGSLNLNDQTWTPPVVLPAGQASLLVQYELNVHEDDNVDTPVFNSAASTVADPGISWDWTAGDLYARDVATFTVVPEPGTMGLLVVGLLALRRWRR